MSSALRTALRRRVAQLGARKAAPRMAWHDGAENDRLHGSHRWIGSQISPDSALEEDLDALRDRSRELYRSDSIGGMIDSDVEHVVGDGFMIQSKVRPRGSVSKERAQEFGQQFEEVFDLWAGMADRTGRKSLWQLSRLAWRMFRCDGECIAILSDVGKADKPFPLAVEIIDGQRLETPPEHQANPLVRMGVEFDRGGEIVAYHIRKTHPYDTKDHDVRYDRVTVDRVIHMFDPWFAGQSRGYPWFSRVISRLRDAKDLDEAGLIRAQVEACFAAFIKGGSGNPLRRAIGSSSETDGDYRIQDIKPGGVAYLGKEEDVIFANPTAQNAVGTLQELNHRRIAAGLNTPYEFLMKDWRGVSFAGGRLILNAAKKSVRASQMLMKLSFFAPIVRRAMDECVILGLVDLPASEYAVAPWIWQRHKCTAPAWEYSVNPVQEVSADVLAVQNNFKTKEECIGERHGDLEDTFEQRASEREMERSLGILSPEEMQAVAAAEAAAENADLVEAAA